MVRVIRKITNSADLAGSHSIPAKFRAQILEDTGNDSDIAEAIFVNSLEMAEKVIARYHYERDFKGQPIFLAGALELVMAEDSQTIRRLSDKS